MPFRWGLYYIAFFALAIVIGFWRSYFSSMSTVPAVLHFHAFMALGWIVFLAVQVRLFHSRNFALHKTIGRWSFALLPLLIISLTLVARTRAERFMPEVDPIRADFELSLGTITFVAIASLITLYYLALRHRKNIKLHGGYMLATPMMTLESSFGRVVDHYLPWMVFWESEGFHFLFGTVVVSNAVGLALAMAIYFSDRKHGAPWLVVSGFLIVQSVALYIASDIPGFTAAFTAFAGTPYVVIVTLAFVAGAVTVWAGWRAGQTSSAEVSSSVPADQRA